MITSYNITIIGAGNLATHLAKALHHAGHKIRQVWSKNIDSANTLANKVSAQGIDRYEDLELDADIYIISVKDAIIPNITQLLENVKGIVLHTSGATDMHLFHSRKERYGVLYPVQTFSKGKALNFKAIPIAIEASDSPTLNEINILASSVAQNIFQLDTQQRLAVHLAAVWANNFSNHFYYISEQILTQKNIDFSILKPLIIETAQKVQELSPLHAQTGPAMRNDQPTLDKHLEFLKTNEQWSNLYQTLSESIKTHNE